VPFTTPRSFDPPRVQFHRELAKGRAPNPDLLNHRQDVLGIRTHKYFTAPDSFQGHIFFT
jgi:hypothetical protein